MTRALDAAALEALARDRGVAMTALAALPDVATEALKPRRIGLFKPWVATMDEGWTRWLLEQHEFPYRSLADADVRKGALRDAYDVWCWPTPREGTAGRPPARHGSGGVHGRPRPGGCPALKEFVRAGGTLVALDSAADLPLDLFGLGVSNVLKGVPRQEYSVPARC